MPRPPCRCTTGNRRFGTGRANSWTEQHSRPRDLYSKKRGLIFLLDAPWLDFRLDAGLTGVASSSWKARLFIHRKRCCLQKTSTFMKTACQLQASSIHGEHILSRTHSVEETSVNHGPAEQPVPSACSLAAASDVLIQRSSSICLFISSPAKM